MSTKQNSLIARANLFVTRARMATAHGSAQGRAFRARQVEKAKRDNADRKLSAQLAADAAGKSDGAANDLGDDAQTTTTTATSEK